jgi:hypothetical protein
MGRSRYFRTPVVDNGYATFGVPRTNQYRDDTFRGITVIEYKVKLGDRLDTLAAKYLNDDTYWWMIALVNNMMMPTLSPGDVIRIPTDPAEILDRI